MPTNITNKSVAAAKRKATGTAVKKEAKADPKGPSGKANGRRRGRPEGSLNKATIFAKQVIEGDLNKVIGAMIAAALDGDIQAQKFLISRFVPPARSEPLQIELPPIKSPTDIVAAFDAIWHHVGAGRISLEDMERLRVFLEAKMKVIDLGDIYARIERLEKHAGEAA